MQTMMQSISFTKTKPTIASSPILPSFRLLSLSPASSFFLNSQFPILIQVPPPTSQPVLPARTFAVLISRCRRHAAASSPFRGRIPPPETPPLSASIAMKGCASRLNCAACLSVEHQRGGIRLCPILRCRRSSCRPQLSSLLISTAALSSYYAYRCS